MSQNDRLNLIDEVQKSTQEALDQLKTMAETAVDKVDQMELIGENIKILCAKIQDRAEKIERQFREFKDRETSVLNRELEDQYQVHKGENK